MAPSRIRSTDHCFMNRLWGISSKKGDKQHYTLWLLCSLRLKSLPDLKYAHNIIDVFNGIKTSGKHLLSCRGETFHKLTFHFGLNRFRSEWFHLPSTIVVRSLRQNSRDSESLSSLDARPALNWQSIKICSAFYRFTWCGPKPCGKSSTDNIDMVTVWTKSLNMLSNVCRQRTSFNGGGRTRATVALSSNSPSLHPTLQKIQF